MNSAQLLSISLAICSPSTIGNDLGLPPVVAHSADSASLVLPEFGRLAQKCDELSEEVVLPKAPSIGAAEKLEDGELSGPYGDLPMGTTAQFDSIIFINGIDTTGGEAVAMSHALASSMQSPIWLIYNDLNATDRGDDPLSEISTWIEKRVATAIEKAGDYDWSVNDATEALLRQIKLRLNEGKAVYIVAHSAGALCALNALREFHARYDDSSQLSRVHVLTVGSPVFEQEHFFSDKWPEGLGSLYHLYDCCDPVSGLAGPGEWGAFKVEHHSFLNHYVSRLSPSLLRQSGTTRLCD